MYNSGMERDRILDELAALFGRMQRIYAEHAEAIGLSCDGCADNCCRTHFHHHTVVEQLFLAEGLRTLEPNVRAEVIERARLYLKDMDRATSENGAPAVVCPLLQGDRCMLYDHRLMICRLHGTPWVLQAGKEAGQTKPGCDRAMACLAGREDPPPPLDRTPLFLELAEIERRVRTATGRTERVNLTLAEMILAIAEEEGWA